jgi:hypothetical protein
MQYFQELGRMVEDRWYAANRDDRAFPDVAASALRDLPAHQHVSPSQILEWLYTTPVLPPQLEFPGRFGQPPLTLYCGHRMVVDVYFWIDSTTSVHQHSFGGAFQVLSGSSHHTTYSFTEAHRISHTLRLGEVKVKEHEYLTPGCVRAIPVGSQLIHSLFHLERPSCTVVVRTTHSLGAEPQYNYQRPHVARLPIEYQEPLVIRRAQALLALRATDRAEFDRTLRRVIETSDLQTVFTVLLDHLGHVNDLGTVVELLQPARKRHGNLIDFLPPVFEEELRQRAIVTRRRNVLDPNHRFFLALLLNGIDRANLLHMVRERHPDGDPIAQTMTWLRELLLEPAPPAAPGASGDQNLLGLALAEDDVKIMEYLLRGLDDAAILAALVRDGYDASGLEGHLAEFRTAISRSYLFRTLAL